MICLRFTQKGRSRVRQDRRRACGNGTVLALAAFAAMVTGACRDAPSEVDAAAAPSCVHIVFPAASPNAAMDAYAEALSAAGLDTTKSVVWRNDRRLDVVFRSRDDARAFQFGAGFSGKGDPLQPPELLHLTPSRVEVVADVAECRSTARPAELTP